MPPRLAFDRGFLAVCPESSRALAALSATAGAAQGGLSDADPIDIAMTSPFFSVYSAPFLAGAAAAKVARGAQSAAGGFHAAYRRLPS